MEEVKLLLAIDKIKESVYERYAKEGIVELIPLSCIDAELIKLNLDKTANLLALANDVFVLVEFRDTLTKIKESQDSDLAMTYNRRQLNDSFIRLTIAYTEFLVAELRDKERK